MRPPPLARGQPAEAAKRWPASVSIPGLALQLGVVRITKRVFLCRPTAVFLFPDIVIFAVVDASMRLWHCRTVQLRGGGLVWACVELCAPTISRFRRAASVLDDDERTGRFVLWGHDRGYVFAADSLEQRKKWVFDSIRANEARLLASARLSVDVMTATGSAASPVPTVCHGDDVFEEVAFRVDGLPCEAGRMTSSHAAALYRCFSCGKLACAMCQSTQAGTGDGLYKARLWQIEDISGKPPYEQVCDRCFHALTHPSF